MRAPTKRGRILLLGAVPLATAVLGARVPTDVGAANGFTNRQLTNPFAVANTEPSVKVAPDGTAYVGAIRGVPSGIDLWRIAPGGGATTYLGSPDSVVPGSLVGFCCAAVGGGDMDLALNNDGTVGMSSLWLGSVTVGQSTNHGSSFLTQPLGGVIPGDDREWNTSDGATMYMSFHDLATGNIDVEKSPAGPAVGLVYAPTGTGVLAQGDPALNNNELGNLVADRQHPGLLYQVYTTPSSGTGAQNQVKMAVSTDGGSTWTQHVVFTGPSTAGYDSVFPAAALDHAGNVFVVVSDTNNVLVFSSTDRGTTWSAPTNVNPAGNAAVMPWIAAGGNGGVVVTWYGADTTSAASANANWNVEAAESTTATSASPSYSVVTVSDHAVRHGAICLQGLACSDGRQMGDFFQDAVGPDGIASIAYIDNSTGAQITTYARGGIALGAPN